MLAYIIGVVLFALGIGISVALHEAGHMFTAKWFGMKVRRYFIGFGPKLWSTRRGETEYGLKALPLGGFCDIAGMTALDEVTPDEAPRAMWKFATWKRLIVMAAGSITHFIVGFIVLYLMAITLGLPNLTDKPVVGEVSQCAQSQDPKSLNLTACKPGDPAPAKTGGLAVGDQVESVDGTPTSTWTDVVSKVQAKKSGTVALVVRRGDSDVRLTLQVATVGRVTDPAAQPGKDNKLTQVGAIGAGEQQYFPYNGLTAFGGTGAFTGQMFANVWEGLKQFPQRIPALVKSIGGGKRDPNTPISVVGASRLGGQAVQDGLWSFFWLLLATLNFFIGVFNLLPLLPMDGGHIAVLLYEKVRDWVRGLRGRAAGGPVDYTKLTAVTMVVVVLGGALVLLTVTADIVNPIRIGQ
ncbi:MAG: site-2 protease family protein [Sciscionella sp.]|nr:site-2 protease family protein [Sciscionella sp.]